MRIFDIFKNLIDLRLSVGPVVVGVVARSVQTGRMS